MVLYIESVNTKTYNFWSEVKCSEVKWSVEKSENETLWEKFIWVVKW